MLVRSWNLFHGNTSPPRRDSYLEEMVRLAVADRPDVVLLQEVPAWALPHLGRWSGMTAITDVANRPSAGPVPIPAGLGRALTSLNPGLLRSAFAGQGNAILLDATLEVTASHVLTLNPRAFRRKEARVLGLDLVARMAWERERRICQAVTIAPDLVLANLHASSSPGDARIPAAELTRADRFLLALARPGDRIVLGGDLNVTAADLPLHGYSAAGPGIDHILVRGAEPSAPRTWPDERRRRDGMLLSDHAPIELDL